MPNPLEWLRARLRLWLGIESLRSDFQTDLDAHGRAHSGVLLETVQQMNSTSSMARQTAYRLSIYESNVPAIAAIKRACDKKARAAARKREAEEVPS